MYCPNCGKQIDDESSFCRYCGTKVDKSDICVSDKEIPHVSLPLYDIPKLITEDMFKLKEGEKMVFETKPLIKCSLLYPAIFGIIIALMGVPFLYFPFLAEMGIYIELIAFLIIFIPYLIFKNMIYGLTTHRIIKITGIIGKDMYECSLNRVQDLRFRINPLQKIFSCGDILISTAGTAGIECIWRNVKNPQEVQRILRSLLDAIRKN
ncbi:PH domain-containing protein [Acetomicrobium sp.]|uniref:PH domain-containing protein n=1 Tax=Acetomicrobium sp. TaxID=1872099 RepID=UPI0028715F54|nr:PH domain-containing protein [Acetomicrobium sp.]MDR9770185.1 PH domain-containing protein [Acetomicrobium sp.]HPT77315.1 PH domain-containing protein [Defluviitaleaceae bacterium]HXK99667.1 PH domain-containing protein [Acetomicrobium sp.]